MGMKKLVTLAISPKTLPAVLAVVGIAALVYGISQVYVPAAWIIGGLILAALGLFVLPVGQDAE